MKLTQQIIHSAGTSGIGFNCHQLSALGINWPPKSGWLKRLVGQEVPDDVWSLVVQLRGKRRKERQKLMAEFADRKYAPSPAKSPIQHALDQVEMGLIQQHALARRLWDALKRIESYPVHSEPVGAAYDMQEIAHDALYPKAKPPSDPQAP